MKRLVVVILMFAFTLAAIPPQTALSDDDNSVDIGVYTSTVIHKNAEDDVEFRDKEGNLVSVSEVFLNEGFQIEKPTDRNVCYIRASDDDSTCYSEEPVTEPLTQKMLDHCSGRQIVVLKPIDCEVNEVDDGDDAAKNAIVANSRQRRSVTWGTCTRYRYTIGSKCIRKKCCLFCIIKCCAEYGKAVIWTSQKAEGYTRQFHVSI